MGHQGARQPDAGTPAIYSGVAAVSVLNRSSTAGPVRSHEARMRWESAAWSEFARERAYAFEVPASRSAEEFVSLTDEPRQRQADFSGRAAIPKRLLDATVCFLIVLAR
jgi:hypothetical protein